MDFTAWMSIIITLTFYIKSGIGSCLPCLVGGNRLDRANVLDLCDVNAQAVYYVSSETLALVHGEVNAGLDRLVIEEPEGK